MFAQKPCPYSVDCFPNKSKDVETSWSVTGILILPVSLANVTL